MSLKLVYTSDVFPYDPTPSPPSWPWAQSHHGGVPWAPIHEWLREPPRQYDESLNGGALSEVVGIFLRPESEESADYNVALWATPNCYYINYGGFAGHTDAIYEFSPVTGAYLKRTWALGGNDLPLPVGIVVSQFEPRTFWLHFGALRYMQKFDALTLTAISGQIDLGKFNPTLGTAFIHGFLIDETRDILLCSQTGSPDIFGPEVGIYRWSTGEFLYKMTTIGQAYRILPAGGTMAYLIEGRTGSVSLIDYARKKILGVSRLNLAGTNLDWITASQYTAYDFAYRRILTCFQKPDGVDGSSNTRVYGYFPTTLPVHLTTPIPTRAGRQSAANNKKPFRVISRLIDDAGIGVGGGAGDWSSSLVPSLDFTPDTSISDGLGYFTTSVTSEIIGENDVQLVAEYPDA